MENYIKHINDLKCIKVVTNDECIPDTWLSFNQYYTSFVAERWQRERRTNKKHTLFGYWHTKVTVTYTYLNVKSIRVFTFPDTEEQARALDNEYYKELEKGGL